MCFRGLPHGFSSFFPSRPTNMKEFDLASLLQQSTSFSLKQQLSYVWRLSVPGILAQISSIIMQYIDAAMVGSLGAEASAAIGLVASSTWLFGGLSHAVGMGFSVQIAQATGAGDKQKAKDILRQGILTGALVSVLLAVIGIAISGRLPIWLGGATEIQEDASRYFLVFMFFLPLMQNFFMLGASLQCAGNMKIPSVLNVLMCALDVVFNFFFIFILKWGVLGAALGSAASMAVVALLMIYFTCFSSPALNLRQKGSWRIRSETLRTARNISLPMGFEQCALCGAYVMSTKIIAPLGTIALAAHSFSITAESLCYMPGYGIGEAATTLVGQSIGAKRTDLAKRFAWLTTAMGMCVMATMGIIMYAVCPAVFRFLTPDTNVRALGTLALRSELWAEALYGAAIVVSGALRGAGDTLVPSIMNLVSMWGVRLSLSYFLTQRMGLRGAWIAMATELCFRGSIFLIRLKREKWLHAKR